MPKKKSNPNKSKNLMYTQQLRHLPVKLEDLPKLIEDILRPKYYALIVHNKDIDKNGRPVEPHVHVILSFDNERYLSATAKKLGDRQQQVTLWDGRFPNACAYLLHHTENSKESYQYDPKDVTANFDFISTVGKIEKVVERAKSSDVKFLLDLLMIGEISKDNLIKQLSGHIYGRYRRQIEDIHSQYLKASAEEWRQKMIAEGRRQEFVWIDGPAGVGKSRLARDYAEKRGQPYFVTGSNRDPFQGYNGEHTIIIDDFRCDTLEYRELLRLTDPFGLYGGMVNAPSRYSDKSLACDLLIITSPYRSNDYYNTLFRGVSVENKRIDTYEQLARRITLWLEFSGNCIHGYKYNGKDWFDVIEEKGRPNPYMQTEQSNIKRTDPEELFDSMVAKPADTPDDSNRAKE